MTTGNRHAVDDIEPNEVGDSLVIGSSSPSPVETRRVAGSISLEVSDCQLQDLDKLVVGEAQICDLHVAATSFCQPAWKLPSSLT